MSNSYEWQCPVCQCMNRFSVICCVRCGNMHSEPGPFTGDGNTDAGEYLMSYNVKTRNKFRLEMTKQCKKCPWRKETDPRDIPFGYCENKHRDLSVTISNGSLDEVYKNEIHVMACHNSTNDKPYYCVGWLMHQLGPGNNIPLRLKFMNCENLQDIVLDGSQHDRFEDTLLR